MRRAEVIEQIKDIIRRVAPTAKPYCTVRKQEMKHVLTATSTCSYCSTVKK